MDKPEAYVTEHLDDRAIVVSTPLGRVVDSNTPVHRAFKAEGIAPKYQKAGYYVLSVDDGMTMRDAKRLTVDVLRKHGIKVY